MTENSYLNGKTLVEQNLGIIDNLERDNGILRAAGNTLTMFSEDNEIKSEAFDNLKQQLNDYVEVIHALRSANDSDIADFRTLNNLVGDRVLDGAVIQEAKRESNKKKDLYSDLATSYAEKAEKYNIFGMSSVLSLPSLIKAQKYASLLEKEIDIYNEYLAKENKYDYIQDNTGNLFSAGQKTRFSAKCALEGLKSSFVNGTYQPDMSASWRTDIVDSYSKRLWKTSADGAVELRMDEIKKILAKDASDIMPREYEALVKAFMHASDDEMEIFISYLMLEPDRYEAEYIDFHEGQVLDNAFAKWEVDKDKTEEMIEYLSNWADNILLVQQSEVIKADPDKYDELGSERDYIMQRATLLESVRAIRDYRGEYDDEYPPLDIETKYNEYGKIEYINVSFLQTIYVQGFNHQRDSSIKIEYTDMSEDIVGKRAKKEIYSLGNYIGVYQPSDETGNFVLGEVNDKILDKIGETVAEKASTKIGKKLLSESIPIIGDLIEFHVDMKSEKAADKYEEKMIEDSISRIDASQMYSYFDCDANFVTYDTVEIAETVIYPYAGERTDGYIKAFNSELRMELDREKIFSEPNAVYEEIAELKKDPEKEKIIERIFDTVK
ncbi:MAG: hypothetical protein U0L79_06140 [Lachnospiraceae bacterium]|nr:hypothetical protein [Lachnospiraceae bacterium]